MKRYFYKINPLLISTILILLYLFNKSIQFELNPVYFSVSKYFSKTLTLESPWFESEEFSFKSFGITHVIIGLLFKFFPDYKLIIWEFLPLIIIPCSVFLWYRTASEFLESKIILFSFLLLNFFYLEPWYLFASQTPRFIFNFIIVPIFLYSINNFDSVKNNSNKKSLIIIMVIGFLIHKLMTLQLFILLFVYSLLKTITLKNYKFLLEIIKVCFITLLLISPAVFILIKEIICSGVDHSFYNNPIYWTEKMFYELIPMLKFSKLFDLYYGYKVVIITFLTIPYIFFLKDFLILKASTIIILTTFLTPLGFCYSIFLTPGVVVETFLAGSVFPVLLTVFVCLEKVLVLDFKNTILNMVRYLMFFPLFFLYYINIKFIIGLNPSNSESFFDKEVVKYLNDNDVIFSDIKTSSRVPSVSNSKVFIADRCNILETPKKNLDYATSFFSQDMINKDIINKIFFKYKCDKILVYKKHINELNEVSNKHLQLEKYGIVFLKDFETIKKQVLKITGQSSDYIVVNMPNFIIIERG